MLKDELIEAVKNGEFSIYPITTVEDAVQILTGVKAGRTLANGGYEANTVFGIVERKLKEMRKLIKPSDPVKKTSTKTTKSKKKK